MTTDRCAGAALALIGLGALWQSQAFPLGTLARPGAAFAPTVLAVLLIGFGVAVAALGSGARRLGDVGWHEARHAVAIFAACGFAAWGLERLGYRLTMAAVLAFLLLRLERRPLALGLGLSLAMAWGSFYLFNTLLKVPLPRGPYGL